MSYKAKIDMPKAVSEIINTLNNCGYEAYAVGGCIRDSILGKAPHDWDICTSALPQEVKECFKGYKIIETGIKHGTVTILINDTGYEVTTYRIDGEYLDNRHPESVSFTRNLKDDLSRRDFTMNALCYNDEDGLIDLFNGLDDINKRVIRCIGEPDKRFNEDALRIMRAIRFASTYSFNIEKNTEKSLIKNKKLLNNIAAERINTELCKLLKGPGAADILLKYKEIIGEIIPEVVPCFNFDQNNPYHVYDVYTHMIMAMDNYKKQGGEDLFVILSLFLHDIGKPHACTTDEKGSHFKGHPEISYEISKEILTKMKFDNVSSNIISKLILYHDTKMLPNKKSVKRMLNKIGVEQFGRLLEMQKADISAHSELGRQERLDKVNEVEKTFEEIKEERSCFSLDSLCLNGKDIMALGVKEGPEVGRMLKLALNVVIEENVENDREELVKFIKEELAKE